MKQRTMKAVAGLRKGLVCAMAAAAMIVAAHAEEPVSFAGKQIKLSIGFSPVAFGYDTYGRVLARHLGRHLPGHPVIIPQNRPGAGSLSLANYVYNAAAKDGTEIALVGRGVAEDPLIGGPTSQAKFNATKFAWLGSMNNEVSGFYIRHPGPAAGLADVLAGTSLQVGSTGPGGDQQIFTSTLNALLGTKLKTVSGFPGSNEITLAVARGELDGVVGYSWAVARVGHKQLLESGRLKIILQLGLEKHPDLPHIPLVTEFVSGREDRRVLELIFARQAMGRPLVAPPGTDPAIVQVLRRAFAETMGDPQFIAESVRIGLEMNFVSGHDVQALVERLYQAPADVVRRAQIITAAY
jgi:tripartite-type tricarboxylate transporter receptor subunit TctC